jgi:hypothetical protein
LTAAASVENFNRGGGSKGPLPLSQPRDLKLQNSQPSERKDPSPEATA